MSRGRHRKPTHTGRNLAVVATTGAFALPITGVTLAAPAHADILDEIATCESGNNPRAQNPSSSASGTWQFIRSTWLGIGGGQFAPTAAQATPAQQRQMAERLYAQQGTSPWNASKHCWAGKSGATPRITGGDSSTRRAPAARAESATAKPRGKAQAKPRASTRRAAPVTAPAARPGVRWANAPADLHRRDHRGHGTYTCDTGHLGYQACDVATLGQVVAYPAFDRH